MKKTLQIFIIILLLDACSDTPAVKKKDSVPEPEADTIAAYVPRGELICEYAEVGMYATDTHWVQSYLLVTADSIIATEVEKLSRDSKDRAAVYSFLAKRDQLDLEHLRVEPHDLIEYPKGYLKVKADVLDTSNKVLQWVSDPRSSPEPETLMTTGIRVVVSNEAQVKEVMEKLRKVK